jgi:hypothetical protein
LPILISVSVTPTSFFFWATATPVDNATAVIASAAARNEPNAFQVTFHSSILSIARLQ